MRGCVLVVIDEMGKAQRELDAGMGSHNSRNEREDCSTYQRRSDPVTDQDLDAMQRLKKGLVCEAFSINFIIIWAFGG